MRVTPHLHQVSTELLAVGHLVEYQSRRHLPLQLLAEKACVC